MPGLRQAPIHRSTVGHFGQLLAGHHGAILVVTSARETAEPAERGAQEDTIGDAGELAGQGQCLPLHYPDPAGLKADQLNHAADYCRRVLAPDHAETDTFLVCYDADSRPPTDSLDHFEHAITNHPDADVSHQSSPSDLRTTPPQPRRPARSRRRRRTPDPPTLAAARSGFGP